MSTAANEAGDRYEANECEQAITVFESKGISRPRLQACRILLHVFQDLARFVTAAAEFREAKQAIDNLPHREVCSWPAFGKG